MRRRSEGNFSGLELGTFPTYFYTRKVGVWYFVILGVVSVQPYCFLGFIVAMMVKKGLGSASLSHAHSTAGRAAAGPCGVRRRRRAPTRFAQGGSIRVCHTRLRFLSSRWLLACLSLGDEGPGTAVTPYASTARSRHLPRLRWQPAQHTTHTRAQVPPCRAPAAPAAAVLCSQVVVMFMGAPALGGVASTRLWPGLAAVEAATALSLAATAVTFGFEVAGAVLGGGAGGGGGTAKTRPLGVWTRKLAGWLAKIAARPPPVVPRYAVRAARPRLVRVWRTYSSALLQGRLLCTSGAYGTGGRHVYPVRTARLRHGVHVNTSRHRPGPCPCPYPDRRGPCPCPCRLA